MLAGFLRRHGADLVVGSHPHVVQPFEQDSTGAVFYSLGNFVSNQRRRYCDGGLLAEVEVVKRIAAGVPTMHYAAQAVPVWVALPDYRILPPEVADTLAMPPHARAAYDRFMQDNGKFALNKTGLLAYSHGEYFDLGKSLGTFGYSVKKKKKVKKKK